MGWRCMKVRIAILLSIITASSLLLYTQWSNLCLEQLVSRQQAVGLWEQAAVTDTQIRPAQILSKGKRVRWTPVKNLKTQPMMDQERAEVQPDFSSCTQTTDTDAMETQELGLVGPFSYIKESKNPCWFNSSRSSNNSQLCCVPYYFLAGVSKCGSTDIFSRLSGHPQILLPKRKELRWFDIRRYNKGEFSFEWYVSNFNLAAEKISREILTHGFSKRIVGDGSPTYFWRNFYWNRYPGNEGCMEPQITIPSVIHHLVPHAKIIISFRNPVDSIYSKYLSEGDKGLPRSPQHFHALVTTEVYRYHDCFSRFTVRGCAYNLTLSAEARVRLEKGLYAVFLADWFRIFPREQILVVRFEDYIIDVQGNLVKMFAFLELDPIENSTLRELASRPTSNPGRHYSVGAILPETRKLLEDFYAPYNRLLADMVANEKFLWKH